MKASPLPIDALVPGLTSLGFSENVANLYREMTEAFGSGKVGFAGTPARGKVTLGEVRSGVADLGRSPSVVQRPANLAGRRRRFR